MQLSQLLANYISIPPEHDRDITSLCLSSRDVTPGALFFACPGEKVDGRDFIEDAVKKGAVVIVAERRSDEQLSLSATSRGPLVQWVSEPKELDCSPPLLISFLDLKQKIGPIAQKFYDYPAKDMQIIGVTGTSGKTSVTNIIAQLLNYLGVNAYVIGTFGVGKPEGPFLETGINTPDPIRLQQYFLQLKQQGCEAIVMEVSSHALVQGRVQGVMFDAAIFTNLTQDHLDYHKTMQEYGLAKERFLMHHHVKQAIFNVDDSWCRELYERYQSTMTCTGFSLSDTTITLEDTQLIGEFNLQNVLAAVTCLLLLGYKEHVVLQALPRVRPIPGRLELVRVAGAPGCVIDYAHKPDALQKALIAVRSMTKGKLFCVFGCGGDRDTGKRSLMAQIAESYADDVCITDDNPRTESSEKILQDILQGFKHPENVLVISDRKTAIETTLARAKESDVVLIAGKGHEDYQIIGTETKYFSDRDVVKEILNRN